MTEEFTTAWGQLGDALLRFNPACPGLKTISKKIAKNSKKIAKNSKKKSKMVPQPLSLPLWRECLKYSPRKEGAEELSYS